MKLDQNQKYSNEQPTKRYFCRFTIFKN